MIPLYGFLEGDTMGLVVLAEPADTMDALAAKVQAAAAVRVATRTGVRVRIAGRLMSPAETVASAGLEPLDRIDVVVGWSEP